MKTYLVIHLLFYTFYNVCCDYEVDSLTYLNVNEFQDTQRLSSKCEQALKVLSERLNDDNEDDDDEWALKMMDSTPKMPTGLLNYNFFHYGSFDECIEIQSKKDNVMGKYCLANMFVNASTLKNPPEYLEKHVYLKNLNARVYEGIQRAGNVKWAYCIPSNCSNEDAKHLINVTNRLGFSVDSVTCQTAEDAFPALDTDGIIGITIFGTIFFLVVASTVIDLYYLYIPTVPLRTKRNKEKDLMKEPLLKSIDKSTEVQNGDLSTQIVKPPEAKPIFLSFSLYSNSKRLFGVQSRPSGLSCLDGMRVFSILWIMLLHIYMLYIVGPPLNPKNVDRYTSQLSGAFFIGGALGCDTFLLVGGTLVTYVFFIKDKSQQLSNLKGILRYYLHRYIRLSPALLGVVIFTVTVFKYMDTGPNWIDGTTEMRESCKQHWLTTLLFIQNQVNVEQMCIRHSWYINVDMQLYLISPIILWILKKYPRTGIFSITVAVLLSMGIYFRREYFNEGGGAHSTNPFAVFDNDYYKTETRAAPWLMGTVLGYFLTKKEYQNYKISKKYLLPLWILSLTLMVLVVIGSQPTIRSRENYVLESALYIALSRPIFALGVAWVIWACATNNGGIINTFLSLPIFNLLNKFIYSVYLLHLMVMNHIMFTARTPVYFSMFDLVYSYCGFVMCSFVVSIFWVLIFESPMIMLEKIILP